MFFYLKKLLYLDHSKTKYQNVTLLKNIIFLNLDKFAFNPCYYWS